MTCNKSIAVLQRTLQNLHSFKFHLNAVISIPKLNEIHTLKTQLRWIALLLGWWRPQLSSNGGRNAFKWRPQLFCIMQSIPTSLQLYPHSRIKGDFTSCITQLHPKHDATIVLNSQQQYSVHNPRYMKYSSLHSWYAPVSNTTPKSTKEFNVEKLGFQYNSFTKNATVQQREPAKN